MKSESLIIILIGSLLFIGCENSSESKDEDIQIDPVSTWTYRDSTYTFVSGLANRRDIFLNNPIDGITVWLTNQDINCLDIPVSAVQIGGAWIGVQFPSLEVRDYGEIEIQGIMGIWNSTASSYISVNLGRGSLTFVDTVGEKRVRGWLEFELIGGSEEGEVSRAYGTFDIPFCSAELDTVYFPKEPISSWTYRDSTYTSVSGLANRRDIFQRNPIDGITVLLTNQDINCLDSPVSVVQQGGAWIGVQFPSLEVRDYGKLELQGMMGFWKSPSSSNIYGNLGKARLTFVDTVGEKRVRGWLVFESSGFEEGEVNRAYGTFDVPFCSAQLDTAYFPKEPISSWTYRDSTYLVVSGIAERRRSAQGDLENGMVLFLTDREISCADTPFTPPSSGATIIIKLPDIAPRLYTSDEIAHSFSVYASRADFAEGYRSLGQAALTFVDTTNANQIRGWIAIKRQDTPAINAYGTFVVPFCSESQ